jgi:hypothetical protein
MKDLGVGANKILKEGLNPSTNKGYAGGRSWKYTKINSISALPTL